MTTRNLVAAFHIPWNSLVAAFVYFAVLAAIVLSGVDIAASAIVGAYLLPAALYLVLLATRAVHAVAATVVDIAPTPQALWR